MTRERSQALAEVQGFLHERVQGISVVKSFAIEDNEAKNFDKKNTNFLTRAFETYKMGMPIPLPQLIQLQILDQLLSSVLVHILLFLDQSQ